MLHAQTLRYAHLKHVFTMVLSDLNAAACAHMQAVDAIMHKAGICMSGKPARKCHSITHYWKFHSRSTFDQPLVKPPASLVVPGSASRKEGFNFPSTPTKHSYQYLQHASWEIFSSIFCIYSLSNQILEGQVKPPQCEVLYWEDDLLGKICI